MSLDDFDIKIRQAARALGRHGLAHAYGHVSVRVDRKQFLVCASKPMAHIAPGEVGTLVPLDGPLPDGVLGEVRIHREIYRKNPQINGVARTMPPHIMSLSTLRKTPKPRHGFGSYFYGGIPLWDSPLLVRDDQKAEQLVELMGQAHALVMRGNGLITVGETVEEAVVRAWYAEDAARIELDVLASNHEADEALITEDEANIRATWSGRILDRMWDYLTYGDPEI